MTDSRRIPRRLSPVHALVPALILSAGLVSIRGSSAGPELAAPQANQGRGAGPAPSDVRHEDCLPHDSDALTIEPQLADTWLLTDMQTRMAMFDRRQDADNALALARRYRLHCYIGRHPSTRPGVPARPTAEYIHSYWKRPTGKTTTISPESCAPYVPAQVRMLNKDAAGWLVTDGGTLALKLDSRSDAEAALELVKGYTQHCVIGRTDLRPPTLQAPSHSRLDYWK